MKRVSDLIDVWFDSGAMPYAQWHFPFENKELFAQNYPADFIAEGVDHGLGREVQRPDVHGNVGAALHHRVALAIAQCGGEVTGVHDE